MYPIFLFLAISGLQSHLQFDAPTETVFAGKTLFRLTTDIDKDDILGLELFINDVSVSYFEERPFETEVNMSQYPPGLVTIKAVLSLFGQQTYEAHFTGRNLPDFEQESVQLVRVPVMLEQPIKAGMDDFGILEDDQPQKIELLYGQEKTMQLVVVLDLSGSMENHIPILRRGLLALIESMRPGDSIQVIGFNHEVFEISPPETDMAELKRRLYTIEARGSTNLYGAVWAGVNATGKTNERRALIVFTDGHHELDGMPDTFDKTREDCITAAREKGVPIFSMGLGMAVNPEELDEFSKSTGGRAFFVKNLKTIRSAFSAIGEELRQQYLICYYSQARKKGWHRLEVTFKGGSQLRYPKKLYFR